MAGETSWRAKWSEDATVLDRQKVTEETGRRGGWALSVAEVLHRMA